MNDLLLVTHIIAGTLGLLSGSFILAMKKGDKLHKLIGQIFFYSMTSSMIISLPLSIQKSNLFLFIIAIWTLYMLISGLRALKKIDINRVSIWDWVITSVMLLFGILLLGFGIRSVLIGATMGWIAIVFGLISLLFVVSDFRFFRGKGKYKNQFLIIHIQRMLGAYIASVTAFLVVNNKILPDIVAWLLPTVLIVPLIVFWIRKWKVEITYVKNQ
jgi:uncharacterized membrane protein